MKTGFYLGVCGHREILFSLHEIEIQMWIQIYFYPNLKRVLICQEDFDHD